LENRRNALLPGVQEFVPKNLKKSNLWGPSFKNTPRRDQHPMPVAHYA
jgi:hypothetical protein